MQTTNRNLVMRHAFESLPVTVLDTKVGKMVFQVMTRNAQPRSANRSNHKRGAK